MPRPSPTRRRRSKDAPPGRGGPGGKAFVLPWLPLRSRRAAVLIGVVGVLLVFALLRYATLEGPAGTQARAERLAAGGNWAEALGLWRGLNATSRATARTHLGEARACLGLGRAAQAERALRRAVEAGPGEAEAYLLLLEIFRVQDRPIDAFALGWKALEDVPPEAHPEVLRELTLIALSDLPDDLARTTLGRWLNADPDDVDARVAYLRRVAAEPRSDDPDRESRIARLAGLVEQHPGHVGAREALVTALADAGEPDRGRPLLERWPEPRRDGRYWRLKGRWALEYDGRPDQAVTAFEEALKDFRHDWRTHYRLARALQNSGQTERARQEAATVGRIRELLEPNTLGPQLDAAFAHLDTPAAYRTLADLCTRAGLSRLAEAWGRAGRHPAEGTGRPQPPPAWPARHSPTG